MGTFSFTTQDGRLIRVGWRENLGSYFFVVRGRDLRVRRGTRPAELPRLTDLIYALAPYAPLPADLVRELREDEEGCPPGESWR